MARRFTIKLADLVIGITTLHDESYRLCADYLYGGEGRPDIVIAIDQEEIDYERELDGLGDYGDAYYETLAVYRKIAEELPRFGRLLAHGSAVAIGDDAYLFMAPSGTGKSTHTRWWRTVFADEGPYMVNDDKPIIGVAEDGFVVYGTPWDGKEHLSSNVRVRLAAVCLLQRGETDHIEALPAGEGISSLMPHVYRPKEYEAMLATIGELHRLSDEVALFEAHVTNSAHAAHVTRAAMAI